MTTVEAAPESARPTPRRGIDPRVGWLLITLLTLVVLASWMPTFGEGLGDNHEGRILGRHALHVSNAHEHGLAGSGWLTDASPYLNSYSNHPPLMNFGYYFADLVLPVDTDMALRIFAYLTGVAMVPVGAALLRRIGFGFGPILIAAGAIAITPLFFNYARLHTNITLLLVLTLIAVRFREDRKIGTTELVVGSVIAMLVVVSGYLGLAAGALLGLWVFAKRRFDRVTVVFGIGLTLGAAITGLYVIGSSGFEYVGGKVEERTVGGDFTTAEFFERMERWREELLPLWWRQILLPIALTAGLLDKRTRWLTIITGLVAIGYIYGLQQGSFMHDYWIFPLLLPVWLGTAALVGIVSEHAETWVTIVVVGVAAVGLIIGANALLTSEVPDVYYNDRVEAGTFVRGLAPPDQDIAWAMRAVPTPRWVAYYWDLPTELLDPEDLADIPDDEVVLVRLDWLLAEFDREMVVDSAVESSGGYLLVPSAELDAALEEK